MKYFISIILIYITTLGFSQVDSSDVTYIISKDIIVIDVNYLGILSNSHSIKPTSSDINTDIMLKIAGKQKHTLAIGVGLNIQNYRSDYYFDDSLGQTTLTKVNEKYEYHKNKFSLVFVSVPIEYRYKSLPDFRKRSFKISVGGKLGYNIQSYYKYRGKDYRISSTTKDVKFKEYNIDNLSMLKYSAHLRIGYGKIAVNFQYYFVPVFLDNKGPEILPYSLGITFIPL